jgi:hypothetical protein
MRLRSRAAVHESAVDAVDGSSTGTAVPWMWVLLRPPRFGGAKYASGNRSPQAQAPVRFAILPEAIAVPHWY